MKNKILLIDEDYSKEFYFDNTLVIVGSVDDINDLYNRLSNGFKGGSKEFYFNNQPISKGFDGYICVDPDLTINNDLKFTAKNFNKNLVDDSLKDIDIDLAVLNRLKSFIEEKYDNNVKLDFTINDIVYKFLKPISINIEEDRYKYLVNLIDFYKDKKIYIFNHFDLLLNFSDMKIIIEKLNSLNIISIVLTNSFTYFSNYYYDDFYLLSENKIRLIRNIKSKFSNFNLNDILSSDKLIEFKIK